MRLVSKAAVSVFSMMLMASFSLAGTIEGMVSGKDGKAAANVPVKLMKGGMGKKEKAPQLAEKGDKKKAPEALMTAMTDTDGKFKFENVEDGSYSVMAGNREAGMGRAMVKVEGGKADMVKIELKDMPKKEK